MSRQTHDRELDHHNQDLDTNIVLNGQVLNIPSGTELHSALQRLGMLLAAGGGASEGGGEQGDSGPPGPPGAAGSVGASGPQGPGGPSGVGEDGADGDPGPPGPPGAVGSAGADGAQGLAGYGPPGADGIDGEDAIPLPGPPGASGVAGPAGAAGPPGFGLDGEDGADAVAIPGIPGPPAPERATFTIGPFFEDDIPGTATTQMRLGFFNTATAVNLATSGVEFRIQAAAHVIGAIIVSDAVRTAGSCEVRVRIGGVATVFNGGACALDATNTDRDSSFVAHASGLVVGAGASVGVALVTSGWTPITANAAVWLVVSLD